MAHRNCCHSLSVSRSEGHTLNIDREKQCISKSFNTDVITFSFISVDLITRTQLQLFSIIVYVSRVQIQQSCVILIMKHFIESL